MSQTTPELETAVAPREANSIARRTRLREFQTQLVERMQAARSGALPHASQLGVVIGESHWLLNLREAGEIVPVGAITKVPLTQDWFLGLTNIRGNLTSVIDLARFCGQPPAPVNKESRIVAFAPALSFNSALLVSRIMGLRNVTEMRPQPQAPNSANPWMAQRYVDRDSRVWTELSLSFIVQDPRFLLVGV
jgi:twitching motility protein PilI